MALVLVLALTDPYVFVKSDWLPAKMQTARLKNNEEYLFKGHLNGNGTFITAEILWLNAPTIDEGTGGFDPTTIPNLRPPRHVSAKFGFFDTFNQPRMPNEKVYEYRSGILIPGILNRTMEFVPEKGGKIIDFSEYVYSEKAKRIYNLPGKFVRFSELLRQEQE